MNENTEQQEPEVVTDADIQQSSKRWQFRRTVIVMSLIFCATIITFLLLYGEDTRLNETIAILMRKLERRSKKGRTTAQSNTGTLEKVDIVR